MENVWFAISTGVISGFVSAALLFIARNLIIGHLLPWYHQQVYRGINVDGTWHASHIFMVQDLRIMVRQKAGLIYGSAEFARRGEESSAIEDSREFDVEGRIQDRFITLTLSHKNRQRIGVVSLLLEPVCDGRELRGYMSFVSIRGQGIDALQIHFAREKQLVVDERLAEERSRQEWAEEHSRQGELKLTRQKKARKKAEQLVQMEADGEQPAENSHGKPDTVEIS